MLHVCYAYYWKMCVLMWHSVRKNHMVNNMPIEVKKAMEKEQMISGRGGRGGMAGGRGIINVYSAI